MSGKSGYVCILRWNLGEGVTGPKCVERARIKLVDWKDERPLLRSVEDDSETDELIRCFISQAEEVIVLYNQRGKVRDRFTKILDDAHQNPRHYKNPECLTVEESSETSTSRDPLRTMLHTLINTANCMMGEQNESIRERVFYQLNRAIVHVSSGCWIIKFGRELLEMFMNDAAQLLQETATNLLAEVNKRILSHPAMKRENCEQIQEMVQIFKEKCYFEIETCIDDWNEDNRSNDSAVIRILACWEIGQRNDELMNLVELKRTLAVNQHSMPEKFEKVINDLTRRLSSSHSDGEDRDSNSHTRKRKYENKDTASSKTKLSRSNEGASNKSMPTSSNEDCTANAPKTISYDYSNEAGGQCCSALFLKSGIPIDAGKQYEEEILPRFGPVQSLINRWIHCLAIAHDELYLLQKSESKQSMDVHVINLNGKQNQFCAVNTIFPATLSNLFLLDTNGSRMMITDGFLVRVYRRDVDCWRPEFELANLFSKTSEKPSMAITGIKMFADGLSFIVCTQIGVYRLPLRHDAHPETNYLWRFTETEMENFSMQKARCVYIDESKNFVMIGSMHKQVHLLSTNGCYIQTLPLDLPEKRHSGQHILVALDVYEELLLAADRDSLHFFKLEF